jgi:hypothetical protein
MNTTKIFPITNGFNKDNLISSQIVRDKDIPLGNPLYDNLGLKTNYIKPGKIHNLLSACQTSRLAFGMDDEINPHTLKVTSILVEEDNEITEHNVNIPFIDFKSDLYVLNDKEHNLDISFNCQTRSLNFKPHESRSKKYLGVLLNIDVVNVNQSYPN